MCCIFALVVTYTEPSQHDSIVYRNAITTSKQASKSYRMRHAGCNECVYWAKVSSRSSENSRAIIKLFKRSPSLTF